MIDQIFNGGQGLVSATWWVAVVWPVIWALIDLNSSMISLVSSGSKFPVGSSASSMIGPLTMARAMQIRCCSPVESPGGKRSFL